MNRKVLILRHKLISAGGAELVFLKEAEYLSKNGFDVIGAAFEMHNNVVGKYASFFKKTWMPNRVGFFSQVIGLRRLLVEERPDIVFTHENAHIHLMFAKALLLKRPITIHHMYGSFMWLKGSELNRSLFFRKRIRLVAKRIITAYGDFNQGVFGSVGLVTRLKIELHALLDYFAIRSLDTLVTCSQSTANEIFMLYHKTPIVIGGGVDVDDFKIPQGSTVASVRSALHLPVNKKMVFTVNRLDDRKRIDLLIEAFLEMRAGGDGAILVIAGKGPDEGRLKGLVPSEMSGDVFFIGFVSDEELKDLYYASDIVAYPAWCAWGLVPLEALAMNKTTIIARDAMVQEAVASLSNVIVHNPDKESLKLAMQKALADRGGRSRGFIEEHLSWNAYFSAILKAVRT